MAADLIVVPYVLGREGVGMGAGPLALQDGAVDALSPDRVEHLGLSAPFGNEVGACFDLNRQLAASVASSAERGSLPVVLTGNCHSQQAVVAGVGSDGLGLVWFDCHGDFHTPDTTPTGFFDGFGLAMIVGDCWTELCSTVPGFEPLAAERVIHAGGRDFETAEDERFAASAITVLGPHEVAGIEERLGAADRVSLHIDLDVLDPAHGRANQYAIAPGLSPDELLESVRAIAAAKPLAAVTLSAYDPSYDTEGRVADTALEILRALA